MSVPEKTKLIKKDRSPLVQIGKPVPPRSQTHPQRQQVIPQQVIPQQVVPQKITKMKIPQQQQAQMVQQQQTQMVQSS